MSGEITIAALGSGGDGIYETAGCKRFLPFGLPGERIDLDRAPVLLEASPQRVEPTCRLHGNVGRAGCGGCRMQHLEAPAYVDWKRRLITEALERVGLACRVEPAHVSPPRSRRRASLAMERRGRRVRVGFNQRGSHDITDMTMCLILRPELFSLVEPLRALPVLHDGERADVLLAVSRGAADLVLERRRPLELRDREELAAFAEEHDVARISWRSGLRAPAEPVAHRRTFTAQFGQTLVNLPAGGFMQATEDGQAALSGVIHDVLPAGSAALDLFAGSGSFSFVAAARGRVHAVEDNAEAVGSIRAARHQAVTAEVRDLFRNPVRDFKSFDAAIFDPPYAGAAAQAAELACAGPPLVIGISCNPVSFARDAKLLCDGGYRLERVVPVDQFLWSAEIEVAAVFRRTG